MTEGTEQPVVLRVANISKEYLLGQGLFGRFGGAKTSLKALDGVDLELRRGEVFNGDDGVERRMAFPAEADGVGPVGVRRARRRGSVGTTRCRSGSPGRLVPVRRCAATSPRSLCCAKSSSRPTKLSLSPVRFANAFPVCALGFFKSF